MIQQLDFWNFKLLRTVANFKTIRDLVPENDAPEQWEMACEMQKLAKEIQECLGASHETYEVQDDMQNLVRLSQDESKEHSHRISVFVLPNSL